MKFTELQVQVKAATRALRAAAERQGRPAKNSRYRPTWWFHFEEDALPSDGPTLSNLATLTGPRSRRLSLWPALDAPTASPWPRFVDDHEALHPAWATGSRNLRTYLDLISCGLDPRTGEPVHPAWPIDDDGKPHPVGPDARSYFEPARVLRPPRTPFEVDGRKLWIFAAAVRASREAQDRVWRRLSSLLFYWRHGTGPYCDVPMGLVLHPDDPRRWPRVVVAARACTACGASIELLRPQAKHCDNKRCKSQAQRNRRRGLAPHSPTRWTVEGPSRATHRWVKRAPVVWDRDRFLTAAQIKHQATDWEQEAA